jgi:hypothetical protein
MIKTITKATIFIIGIILTGAAISTHNYFGAAFVLVIMFALLYAKGGGSISGSGGGCSSACASDGGCSSDSGCSGCGGGCGGD